MRGVTGCRLVGMKIHVLMENSASSDDFAAEHGLSLLVETAGRHILFDTGASAAFADNAEKMGVDLSRVELAVLSHGHYDHGGGLTRFLEVNTQASVWVSASHRRCKMTMAASTLYSKRPSVLWPM